MKVFAAPTHVPVADEAEAAEASAANALAGLAGGRPGPVVHLASPKLLEGAPKLISILLEKRMLPWVHTAAGGEAALHTRADKCVLFSAHCTTGRLHSALHAAAATAAAAVHGALVPFSGPA